MVLGAGPARKLSTVIPGLFSSMVTGAWGFGGRSFRGCSCRGLLVRSQGVYPIYRCSVFWEVHAAFLGQKRDVTYRFRPTPSLTHGREERTHKAQGLSLSH